MNEIKLVKKQIWNSFRNKNEKCVLLLDGRIILKWTCERLDGGAWTGSIWLRIGTGGEHL
jgi:hypothetical protein